MDRVWVDLVVVMRHQSLVVRRGFLSSWFDMYLSCDLVGSHLGLEFFFFFFELGLFFICS